MASPVELINGGSMAELQSGLVESKLGTSGGVGGRQTPFRQVPKVGVL